MKDMVPCMVEAGVDRISSLQPPDIGDVVLKEDGDRVTIFGGLDSCYTFDMGNPDIMRKAVRQSVVDAGEGRGYIVGTGEAVDPTLTTSECLKAAADAAREFGIYK